MEGILMRNKRTNYAQNNCGGMNHTITQHTINCGVYHTHNHITTQLILCRLGHNHITTKLWQYCGKHTAPLPPKIAPHAFESFDIELFHIVLLSIKSWLLSLLNLGQSWPWEGVKSGDNKRFMVANNYDKYTYRNHRIKNIILDQFRAFQGWFYYIKNLVGTNQFIIKTYTKATFYHAKGCPNIYKFLPETF